MVLQKLIRMILPYFPYITWSRTTKRYQNFESIAPKVMFRTRVSNSKEMNIDRVIVEKGFVYEKETHLTVMKTSMFFVGDGFAIYNSNDQVVFCVDSYGQDNRDVGELVLMDSSGRCLLTVRRKRPSLHQRWEGFLGERMEGDKPILA
uniref:Uncharacterized protein n=1 Tax=Lactuca sativa TaxID=4236 RepID=A0A9R1XEJ1_LACSA|nr:hypothetical protein LSAT_V11C500293190 [Lactuca sativa]